MEKISILLGKSVKTITKLRGNGGSALPGLIIERTNPKFINSILSKLPYGVIVVSGTNGKTTTTKIISELLAKQGLKVFTNKSGSNFVRGVISAIIDNISLSGKFNYDVAVLELDEAHAVKFSEVAPIDYCLLLNVQRDQLDRFGEIDHTANLLQKIALKTKKVAVLNREDTRVSQIEAKHRVFFGLSDKLLKKFPTDDDLLSTSITAHEKHTVSADVIFDDLKENQAYFKIDGKEYQTTLALKGIYNAFNAAGALALCMQVLPNTKPAEFVKGLANIKSAFGRGETLNYNGQEIEILLVKNPSAFQLSLTSFANDNYDYMIAINDNIADGRDVSWLWNVDFSVLKNVKVTSGIRATDMALRLKYDNIKTDYIIENINTAIEKFSKSSKKPKRIFATYTAMLEIRKIISGKSIL